VSWWYFCNLLRFDCHGSLKSRGCGVCQADGVFFEIRRCRASAVDGYDLKLWRWSYDVRRGFISGADQHLVSLCLYPVAWGKFVWSSLLQRLSRMCTITSRTHDQRMQVPSTSADARRWLSHVEHEQDYPLDPAYGVLLSKTKGRSFPHSTPVPLFSPFGHGMSPRSSDACHPYMSSFMCTCKSRSLSANSSCPRAALLPFIRRHRTTGLLISRHN